MQTTTMTVLNTHSYKLSHSILITYDLGCWWDDKHKTLSILYYSNVHVTVGKGVRALRGYFGPPLEPKTESCFSPISSYWFIRRKAQV